MSTDLAKREQVQALAALSNDQLKFIANTDFIPKAMRGNLPAILACVATGRAMGLADMDALRSINIIDGKASMSAELMVKLARRNGHSISGNYGDGEVTVTGKRADTGDEMSVTWTIAMAQRAGLVGKDNWKKYPEAMLWARAASQLCRMLFPDVLGGVSYTPDEAELTDEDRVVETLTELRAPTDSGPDDTIDEPAEEVVDFSGYVIEGTVHNEKTLAQVLAEDDGQAWLKTKLKSLAADHPLRTPIEGFVAAELPEVWAAYTEWRQGQ